MPTVRCPACDDRVEIDADWYGRAVACPTCDRQFTPRRPGREDARDDRDDDRPRRRSRSWEDDEYDRPRRRRPERPRSGGGGVWWVLGIVGGVLLLGCLGCGGWLVYSVTAPISYPDPWVTQSLPDDRGTSMQFPRSPTSENLGSTLAGDVGTKYSLIESPPKDAGFAFGYVDFPLDEPGLFDKVYKLEMDELTRATKATIKREAVITVGGHKCKEAELALGGSRATYRLIEVTGRAKPRYLIVFVGGRSVSDADQKKFLNSLSVNGRK